MTPVATTFFFYFLSAVAITTAIAVVVQKNPVHSAVSLVLTLLSLAGLYLMLYAPFIAGVQIILYVGGIMVLFLFVIMLVNIERAEREQRFSSGWQVTPAVIVAAALGALFVFVYLKGHHLFPGAPPIENMPVLSEGMNTQNVGQKLYVSYLLPFEIASVLLLVAIVGAVVMAKKRI